MCANYVSYQNTHTTLMILDSQCKLCVSSSVHNLTVYLCLLRELQLCLEHDRKWKRMCSWKLFSLHFKKQKQKAVQSAGKSGELAVSVHACLCVCVCEKERARHTQRRQDICEVMPHKVFSVRLVLFWRDMGRCGGETNRQLDPLLKGQTVTQSQRGWKMCTHWG